MFVLLYGWFLTRAQISGRQTPGWTRGSPPFYMTNAGGDPRVKPRVWRPEMWAQKKGCTTISLGIKKSISQRHWVY
jgi:hypothetical protein